MFFINKISVLPVVGILGVAYLAPSTYCSFQKKYKADAIFVGGLEIGYGALGWMYYYAKAQKHEEAFDTGERAVNTNDFLAFMVLL